MNFEALLESIVERGVKKALASLGSAKSSGGFLSVGEVAARAKVSAECVRDWIHSGKLKASRPGGRRYLVAEEELAKFLEGQRVLQVVGGPVDVDSSAEALLVDLSSRRKR